MQDIEVQVEDADQDDDQVISTIDTLYFVNDTKDLKA